MAWVSPNCGRSHGYCIHKSLGMHSSNCWSLRQENNAPHGTEIKLRMWENTDNESAYKKRVICTWKVVLPSSFWEPSIFFCLYLYKKQIYIWKLNLHCSYLTHWKLLFLCDNNKIFLIKPVFIYHHSTKIILYRHLKNIVNIISHLSLCSFSAGTNLISVRKPSLESKNQHTP